VSICVHPWFHVILWKCLHLGERDFRFQPPAEAAIVGEDGTHLGRAEHVAVVAGGEEHGEQGWRIRDES
jgi:hypothetical protein